MKLFIDGIQRVDGKNVQIQEVLESVYAQQRYVKDITINGQLVGLNEFAQDRILDKDIVEVQTCTLDVLIEDSMESASVVVSGAYKKTQNIIDFIRVGDISKGASNFVQIIDAIQWNFKLLSELTSLHPGPSVVHELQDEGKNIIPVILGAWENEDFVLLCDVLEFEVLPWLEKWNRIIELFKSERKLEHVKKNIKNLH